MKLFGQAAFLASAGLSAQIPPPGPAEIAFAGRSNVGKSSAINALTGRRRLAFSSKTPGRTQTINFYDLGDECRLVDLPGYGYARAPRTERDRWEQLVGGYLQERETLIGVVVVMDARRPVMPQDDRLLDWLAPFSFRLLALLTKADKLSRTERAGALAQAKRVVGEALLFSSVSREGVESARERLAQWLLEYRSSSPK
ncbi:MAG TPA: ribosome biogenesis GTP-binding protein YihA/YsxC [Sphingomonadaceae bacterium]|nr:ribosome biogenesis GTP-binding protein YihA/YsxC [Sphingomonadaceae bacterium]